MRENVTCLDRVSARIGLLMVVSCVFLLLITAKLAGIQIMHHREYRTRADRHQTIRVQVQARRGEITDRNGYLLAGNLTEASFSVYWPMVPPEKVSEVDSFALMLGDYLTAPFPLNPPVEIRLSPGMSPGSSPPGLSVPCPGMWTAFSLPAGCIPWGLPWRR